MDAPGSSSLSDRLLDAQVAWLLGRLDPGTLQADLVRDVADLMTLLEQMPVTEAVAPEQVKELLHLVLERVPAGAAASTFVEVAADAVHEGPSVEFTAADLVDRDQVEALFAAALSRTELIALVLDKVAESPLAASVASRFVARVVGDVLATNRAVADKIPGMGSLMSLGTSMAGMVAGAADKQFEAVFGDTAAGKGATFAVRRLNKLLLDTLREPTTLAAALEIFDMYATEPLTPLFTEGALGDRDELLRVGGMVQDLIIGTAPAAPVRAFVDRLVDGFYGVYGAESVASLIDDLGIGRDEILSRAQEILPPLMERAIATGEVERILRERLAEFWSSAEVTEILGE